MAGGGLVDFTNSHKCSSLLQKIMNKDALNSTDSMLIPVAILDKVLKLENNSTLGNTVGHKGSVYL